MILLSRKAEIRECGLGVLGLGVLARVAERCRRGHVVLDLETPREAHELQSGFFTNTDGFNAEHDMRVPRSEDTTRPMGRDRVAPEALAVVELRGPSDRVSVATALQFTISPRRRPR